MGRARISKHGSKFLKEADLKDLIKAIRKKGGSGTFKSNDKTYTYNVIGCHHDGKK